MSEQTFLVSVDGTADVFPPAVDEHVDGWDLRCPVCDQADLSLWADDGEADLADWWECQTYGGGCGAKGALVLASDPTKTQNGLDAVASPPRRFLVARFDVTGLSQGEIDALAGEVVCQAERRKPMFDDDPGHPDVHVTSEIVEEAS